MSALEPAAAECLERTRSTVLNVLVGIGVAIAVSGWLLRQRDRWPASHASVAVRRGLLGALLGVTVISYTVRRVLGSRTALREPEPRGARFFRAHVLSAAIAAAAIPLGLAYGWIARPALNEVAPFWIAALGLGVLALPRAYELEQFDDPMPDRPRGEAP